MFRDSVGTFAGVGSGDRVTAPTFDPKARVASLGLRAFNAVQSAAAGEPWTFHHVYAAAEALRPKFSSLSKRLHVLGAEWAVNHREVRA